MPYNPNDPTSDPNNPEPADHSIPAPIPPELTVWEMIESIGPKSMYEGWDARFTVAKLEHIYENFAAGVITKDIAMKMLDALEAGDISEYCKHPTTSAAFEQAITAFRAL